MDHFQSHVTSQPTNQRYAVEDSDFLNITRMNKTKRSSTKIKSLIRLSVFAQLSNGKCNLVKGKVYPITCIEESGGSKTIALLFV